MPFKGLGDSKFVLNSEWGKPYITPIGSFVINCGALENLSIQYLNVLAETEEEFAELSKKGFDNRVGKLIRLLKNRGVENDAEVIVRWKDVKDNLLPLRNTLCHNPITEVTSSEGVKTLCVLIHNSIKGDRKVKSQNFTPENISKLADLVAEATNSLAELLEPLKSTDVN